MAVREPFQRDFPALPVDELRRGASRDHRADGTHRHAGALRGLRERLDAILRRSCTGSRNRRRRRSTSPCRQCRATPDPARAPRQRDRRQIDHRRYAGHAAQLGEIAGKAIGHIHRGAGMVANDLRQRHARLRHAIAPDQRLARGRIGRRGVRPFRPSERQARARRRRSCPSPSRGRRALRRCDEPSCPAARGRTR